MTTSTLGRHLMAGGMKTEEVGGVLPEALKQRPSSDIIHFRTFFGGRSVHACRSEGRSANSPNISKVTCGACQGIYASAARKVQGNG